MTNLIESPTGLGLRMDAAGYGYFGAKRGNRLHLGHDFLCQPGQEIVAPATGSISRIARPYADDSTYSGIELICPRYRIKMFYLLCSPELVGADVSKGQVIGVAQAISRRYASERSPEMRDHVHLQMTTWAIDVKTRQSVEVYLDPAMFLEAA